MTRNTGERWLTKEGSADRRGRRERLEWMASQLTDTGLLVFHAGWFGKYLFEEARYSFVYGQYLATILLAFSFIERTLASIFYAAGSERASRTNAATLLQDARDRGWFSDAEFLALDRSRVLRNDVTHFRPPGDSAAIEHRSFAAKEQPYEVLEADARHVIGVAMKLLHRFSVAR